MRKWSLEKLKSLFRFNISFKLSIAFGHIVFRKLFWISVLLFVLIKSLFLYVIEEESIEVARLNAFGEESASYQIERSGFHEEDLGARMVRLVKTSFTSFGLPDPYKIQVVTYQDYRPIKITGQRRTDHYNQTLAGIGLFLGVLFVLSWLKAYGSAYRLSKKQLVPLKNMHDEIRDISVKHLGHRLDVSGIRDELKDLAITFNELMDKIEASYELQKTFVSDASHELRTPIAVISGYANLLSRWGMEDQEVRSESIEAIIKEAKSMQSLVESLLFIARSEQGTLQLAHDRVDLGDLLEEIKRETMLYDDHKVSTAIGENLIWYGDRDKLKQALRIFVDNAIKYTPHGKTIYLKASASKGNLVLVIMDEGIGISKEDLAKVFDRFYRVDKARERDEQRASGSGLGLAIAKMIIELHEGRILMESEEGVGTRVTIFLSAEKKLAPS